MPESEKFPDKSKSRRQLSARTPAPAEQHADVLPALRPPRQSRSEATLANMLRAGRELIEQHGDFDDVVIADVIRAAGTSTGAFYCRFKDKDAFVAAVVDATFIELRADADKTIEEDAVWRSGDARAIIGGIVHHYTNMCRRNRGVFRAVLRYIATGAPDSHPMRLLDCHIKDLVIPVLAPLLTGRSTKVSTQEIRSAIQMISSTLAMAVLTDPGPMRFEGGTLESQLRLMMQRYLRID
ncbi:TetR/AcrR family transcriptional regulator [Burkholderia sp. D-99]|uniref:TetR/AcrR family transcriptional regulator n=1 Tax=Burkholderia sp. D-99 TaxID=2717316 RepID=UPI00141F8BB5|nr:TetR/AcrR family transcriptional regulator [Burkholderia sp. D-99]NHV25920.1 TetR/AcrR family transcriptional regulator [Burkholderia sp. D-99]